MRRDDPVIVGGGPAGSAAAIMLARGGARPLVLERQSETGDALCGGFLSWRTVAALGRLGIDVSGHPITRLRVTSGGASAEAPLPQGAIGLSRRTMDSALIDRAVREGARVERGVSVRVCEGRILRLGDGTNIAADTLFLATGKHDLRGLARPRLGSTLGLRIRLPATPALHRDVADRIELHLFRGGYAGLILQEDGTGNLCLAVRRSRLGEAGGNPARLLIEIAQENACLGDRLGTAELPRPDAIAGIPYGWRARETAPGIFRLGDQAAVIPSLAGEGNGIALASGVAAARAWLAGQSAHDFQQDFARQALRPVSIAHLLWKLAEAPLGARAGITALNFLPGLARHLANATRIGY